MVLQALVVEDEPALQLFYRHLLEKAGYEVFLAGNGSEAIQLLNQHTPRLIFLDMLLPMVNGEKVLTHILSKPELEQTHVVVASSAAVYAKKTGNISRAEFWLKPIRPAQVQQIAERLKRQQLSP